MVIGITTKCKDKELCIMRIKKLHIGVHGSMINSRAKGNFLMISLRNFLSPSIIKISMKLEKNGWNMKGIFIMMKNVEEANLCFVMERNMLEGLWEIWSVEGENSLGKMGKLLKESGRIICWFRFNDFCLLFLLIFSLDLFIHFLIIVICN